MSVPTASTSSSKISNKANKVTAIALLTTFLSSVNPLAAFAQNGEYCQFDDGAIAEKTKLRQAAFASNTNNNAAKSYQAIVKQHSQALQTCRQKSWLKTQGIWLRLYPCDLLSGKLDEVMDRIVNQGYNQVFVEVLSDGKILLPQSTNATAWQSLVNSEKYKNADLLQLAIAKGRERGLKVHAWIFTMNFGKGYAQGVDRNGLPKQTRSRQQAIARNGNGDSTISIVEDLGKNLEGEVSNGDQLFVDPYNYQAQSDLHLAVYETVKRKPDGVVFDYVRYKRGAGASSVVSNVRYLWIYGEASLRALGDRAQNNQGRELINRFLTKGFVTANDMKEVKKLYPQEASPLWQNLRPADKNPPDLAYWQTELWRLAASHAFVGVTHFLDIVSQPVFRQGIRSGIAFFSDGNQPVGGGFDSRMQPWHLFTNAYEWQPMAYAVCGKPDCIAAQVRKVAQNAPNRTAIAPILVGQWGQPFTNRPSLELQMQAIRAAVPNINSISHFAFGWQKENAEFSRSRQFCRL